MTKSLRRNLKMPRGFIECLARSNFSFLQAASHPEEMIEQAIRLDYDGIAISDLNGLYGVARAFQAAKSPSLFSASLKPKDNFKYFFGTEVVLTDQSSLCLIPTNQKSYSQLCELLTLGKRMSTKGFSKLSLADIAANADELIAFAIPPCGDARFLDLQAIFGDRLYVPVWRDLTWESHEFYRQALHLEKNFGAQLFVTQRAFMHSASRKALFDVLTCIHHKCTLMDARDKLMQNSERYLRPLEDLAWLWQDRIDLLETTLGIANRVHFSLDEIRYRYPRSQLPPETSVTNYLRFKVDLGLKKRFPHGVPEKVLASVDHEMDIISDLQYEDYFLTLFEICEFADQKKILFQGRGSAANSVVCYALGLTNVNPTEIDLLFERFISRERGEPPDIDIDFEHERREEVIQHIYDKYGEQHAAMVCTVIRYKSRMSVRETAKVFGIQLRAINAMIQFMGRDGVRRLVEDPSIRKKFGLSEEIWPHFLQIASELRGFPRHLGIHTGGFIITQNPLSEMVPVEKASMTGRYVIQWNKDDVAFLKLMKIDILSLGMLTALRRCLDLLQKHRGLDWNLAQIPSNDLETYQMIRKADTVGVFQIESRAQMNTLPRLAPKNFYDLIVQIALVRPGPLQGGMVHPYLRRRQGLEQVNYAHPDLEKILEKTMGVPIFQEQVMKIAMVCAGFTPGESDELRRVMSSAWRKKVTMDGVQLRIVSGLLKHGISQDYADKIYKVIEGFANYGFPESHSASFAVLTYASSYLKCHHPEVFACALLNSQPMGFYAPRSLVADAQRHGVVLRSLDIQRSDYEYTLEDDALSKFKALRVGFKSLYGIPEALLQVLVENRKKNGDFQSLADFIRRVPLPRSILSKLAASGAFSCFESKARDLIWKVEALSLDQNSFLWGELKENFHESESMPFESNWAEMQREYASKGYSIEHHPLSILRPWLEEKNEVLISKKYLPYLSSTQIFSLKNKASVRLPGLVSITQRPPTAKGMCFITLEDEFGSMNIVIPPDIYQRDRIVIYSKSLLEIQGRIERSGPILNIKAERVLSLT